jgi:hypothetical protein
MLRVQSFRGRVSSQPLPAHPVAQSPYRHGRRPRIHGDVSQCRGKIQKTEGHESADEKSKQSRSMANRYFSGHSCAIHVRCSTVIDGRMLRPWPRIGVRERSTLQVPRRSSATAARTRAQHDLTSTATGPAAARSGQASVCPLNPNMPRCQTRPAPLQSTLRRAPARCLAPFSARQHVLHYRC